MLQVETFSIVAQGNLIPVAPSAFVLPFSNRTLLWSRTKDYSRHHFMISVMIPVPSPACMLPRSARLIRNVVNVKKKKKEKKKNRPLGQSLIWSR